MENPEVRPDSPAPVCGPVCVQVAVDAPLWGVLDYLHPEALPPGALVRVPLGRQTVGGVVLGAAAAPGAPRAGLRAISEVLDAVPPFGPDWLALLQFAASYYQRPLGELMAAALPGWLRMHGAAAVARRLAVRQTAQRLAAFRLTPAGRAALAASVSSRHAALWRLVEALGATAAEPVPALPVLTAAAARKLHPKAVAVLESWAAHGWLDVVPQPADAQGVAAAAPAGAPAQLHAAQQAAVDAICAADGFAPFLLFGVTGSGKTEVYLSAAAQILATRAHAQVLVLTPEINLTPPLVQRFAARFPGETVAVLHSGLAEAERFDHWHAAHSGAARIVLGTRLAALASLPHLALIVVDEEHDASYKQQEGARYSARDLAVWRARERGIAIVLGSATPSLETWQAVRRGRYRMLELPQRASGRLPQVRLLDVQRDPALRAGELIGAALQDAIRQRLARGEQSLLFLNRRGYAPVLRCPDCGWLTQCPHCDAHLVYHRTDRTLRCHHCGHRTGVPRACPDCGSLDLQPVGRGTQRVEEAIEALFPQARIARIDADSARRKGAAQSGFAQVHAGEVDILVGTQMVTKGHDFQRVTLVAALNPDAGLFTHDLRGPERLFAQLMQAAGRAGRAELRAPAVRECAEAAAGAAPDAPASAEPGAEMLVQTAYPEHLLYRSLIAHDYPGFAAQELIERQHAGMPPFSYQALLRAEHKKPEVLEAFLAEASALADAAAHDAGLTVYPPVPASLARLAGVHRQHILIEGASRGALQAFLLQWRTALQASKSRARWAIDVDPTEF